MAQRGIREYHGKKMMARHLPTYLGGEFGYDGRIVLVDRHTDWAQLKEDNPWLGKDLLVAKPDQLFGKRGKHGLVLVKKNFEETRAWIKERMGKETKVGDITGTLTHFLIEPWVPHDQEYYVAIKSGAEGDTIYFSLEGGINVEENWEKVISIQVPVLEGIESVDVEKALPKDLGKHRPMVAKFLIGLYKMFADLHFTYLEINPFAIADNKIIPLDLVAKLDDTAEFCAGKLWGDDLEFPAPFGRELTPEEQKVRELDAMSGASLKLTLLNPDGRIWNMVAGGGASVIYADTVCDLGYAKELAFYGEYSGDPSTQLTYEYAKVIMDLMTRKPHPEGKSKALIIGGGIANFTDVAKTFTGIIMALKEYAGKLKKVNTRIYVRRGGPNYHEGLANIRKAAEELGLPIEVHGPEYHMTRIVKDALQA
ncbi:MAG: ATP-citrate (pro-S-)-lyase, subunit 1 [Candidatus Ozemobacter sibiricus]|uniref:ATP-citrate (Pro-S-)-lyase, subunit 1 n=1 Tax=Candidatus Ozemobacter sibiricus TaxID=2268124 RepID=A0A367ZP12_9BACT|nr:MAG: ATP-citrate (pro-S-)-lyase, subunit 1 [Candidatus Ozemobacter sibiricus]